MDTASDNPLRRFTSFWLGLAIFLAFAIVVLLLGPLLSGDSGDSMYEAAAERRLETKADLMRQQAEVLPAAKVEAAFSKVGPELLATEIAAVEDPTQVVPGSPRAMAIAEAPTGTVEIEETDPDAPIDPAVMEAGQAAYVLCQACHGASGEGVAGLAPPLANSEWVNGPVENLIRIQLRGLTGPITVNGVDYNLPAPMIAQAFQTDEQIASVLTYIRNSWGNKGSAVTPGQVEAFRGEVGKPPLTVADLIDPLKGAGADEGADDQ